MSDDCLRMFRGAPTRIHDRPRGPMTGYAPPLMGQAERSPFATELGQHLSHRFGHQPLSDPTIAYVLDPQRLREADEVEEFAWVFRTQEARASQPGDGPGRIRAGEAPRLAHCARPRRWRRKRGVEDMYWAGKLADATLCWGYELGMGLEVEDLATLSPAFDRVVAWEIIMSLCQQSAAELAEKVMGSHDVEIDAQLIERACEMVGREARGVASELGWAVKRRELANTIALLVNAGFLMRLSQQQGGTRLHDQVERKHIEIVRERWPSPLAAAGLTDGNK